MYAREDTRSAFGVIWRHFEWRQTRQMTRLASFGVISGEGKGETGLDWYLFIYLFILQ